MPSELTYEQVQEKNEFFWAENQVVGRPTYKKDPYYDTMFYKTYIGPFDVDE